MTSDDALDLPAFPKRVVIIGAGYIGMEFASIFNAFGAEVHLVCKMVSKGAGVQVLCSLLTRVWSCSATLRAWALPQLPY